MDKTLTRNAKKEKFQFILYESHRFGKNKNYFLLSNGDASTKTKL